MDNATGIGFTCLAFVLGGVVGIAIVTNGFTSYSNSIQSIPMTLPPIIQEQSPTKDCNLEKISASQEFDYYYRCGGRLWLAHIDWFEGKWIFTETPNPTPISKIEPTPIVNYYNGTLGISWISSDGCLHQTIYKIDPTYDILTAIASGGSSC